MVKFGGINVKYQWKLAVKFGGITSGISVVYQWNTCISGIPMEYRWCYLRYTSGFQWYTSGNQW